MNLWAMISLLAALVASSTTDGERGGEEVVRDWNLRAHGSFRKMFHEDRLGPVVSLDEILPNADLCAVGALAHLAGEITIVAGVAYIGLAAGTDSSHTRQWSGGPESACLLVSAEVQEWIEVPLVEEVACEGLDRTLAEMAQSAGLDVDEAFPFIIEGEVRKLSWHVIDGERLEPGTISHADHLKAAVRSHREQASATLIGFYSRRDHGVFTHMDSNTHIHCVMGDPPQSGHVDDVILPAGTRIRLPAATGSR